MGCIKSKDENATHDDDRCFEYVDEYGNRFHDGNPSGGKLQLYISICQLFVYILFKIQGATDNMAGNDFITDATSRLVNDQEKSNLILDRSLL